MQRGIDAVSGDTIMQESEKFQAHYAREKAGKPLPWQHAEPNRFLDPITETRDKPGKALDLGCGSGVDSVHLAELGWRVTSLDFMQQALDMTVERAREAGVTIEPVHADVTEWDNDSQFDLLLDSGLLHNMSRDKIAGYRERILQWLQPDGDFVLAHWESRADNDRLRGGARRASRAQLVEFFAPELIEHRFGRLEADGLPARVGPDLSVGFYWFRRS